MSSSENDSNASEDQFEDEEEDSDSDANDEVSEEETDGMNDENETDNDSDEDGESDQEDGSESEEGDSEDLLKNKAIKSSAVKSLKGKQLTEPNALGKPKKEAIKEKAKTEVMGSKVNLNVKSKETVAADVRNKDKKLKDQPGKGTESPKAEGSKAKIPFHQTKKDIKEKYDDRKGKSLFVRFAKRLPQEPEQIAAILKEHCPLVLKVRRPRQPSTRFCLVDFHSSEDRMKAAKQLRKATVDGKKLIVQTPKTDSDDFIEELIKKRRRKLAENRARKKLQKSVQEGKERAPNKGRTYTSTIMIRNIPMTASVDDIKSNFPEAVEFKLLYSKGPQKTNSATVTLPTPKDATAAKRKKISIGEHMLNLSFAGEQKKPKVGKPQQKTGASDPAANSTEDKEDSKKPVANGKNKRKKEKRKAASIENSVSNSSPKKIKTEIESPVKKIKVEAGELTKGVSEVIRPEKIKKVINIELDSEVNTKKEDNSGNLKAKYDMNKKKQKPEANANQNINSPSKFDGKAQSNQQSNQANNSKSKFGNTFSKDQKLQRNRELSKNKFKRTGVPSKNIEEKFSIRKDLKTAQFSNKSMYKGKGGQNRNQQGFKPNSQKFNGRKGEFGGKKNFNKKSMRP